MGAYVKFKRQRSKTPAPGQAGQDHARRMAEGHKRHGGFSVPGQNDAFIHRISCAAGHAAQQRPPPEARRLGGQEGREQEKAAEQKLRAAIGQPGGTLCRTVLIAEGMDHKRSNTAQHDQNLLYAFNSTTVSPLFSAERVKRCRVRFPPAQTSSS